jgi:hypothetical protein
MENLRRWEMNRGAMFNFQIATDARFSRTDYTDDQVWKLNLGSRDNPALAFQTQFGGRAGLVSIVPMWVLGGRTVFQYQTYTKPPIVTHFAPGYLRAESTIVPDLELVAQYWAMESRAAGGEYLLTNTRQEDFILHIDLFGHVGINNRNRKLNVLTFSDSTIALHLGEIGNINPVVVLEGANLNAYGGYISSPKIGCNVVIPPGETIRVPFVIAGLGEMRDSVSLAMNWLARPWTPFLEQIDLEATAVPQISTGDDSWDRLLDLSYSHVVNAFMKPTDSLPHASFVASRASDRGWSRRGDGTDHIRIWSGQDPTLAYLIAPVIANIDPNLAKGIIYNYLSTQDESGFIDRQPGLAGQRQGAMMMPLLARMVWMIYQQTEDQQFLSDTFAKLCVFFQRWFNHDLDKDGDGVPEWTSERQLGYVAFPTFAMGQAWGQGANIRQMETPDLLAYLISEADALLAIADKLGEKEDKKAFNKQRKELEKHLKEFWDGKRFTYRDRDSHITTKGVQLLDGVPGDESYTLDQSLVAPNRVVIRVVGGVSHRPKITLYLNGKDHEGNATSLEASSDEFLWQNRQGMYTTSQAFSYIDSIQIKGLSRVYKIYAETIDSSRLDINHLLPLWTGRLTKTQAKALVKLAMDEEHFMRPNGFTMVSAQDSDFDASNASGGGGIWMYWLALIGEGMVKSGYRAEATQLIKKVLNNLSKNLENDGHLSQFYDADKIQGFGEDGHIGGIVPLNLLMDIIGIRIISYRKVWVGGEFTWGQDITVHQHGVTVTRSADGIQIQFPSDHEITLDAEPMWQAVIDPEPIVEEPAEDLELPKLPEIAESESEKRVMIEVEGQESGEEAPNSVEPESQPSDNVESTIDDSEPSPDSEPDEPSNS